MPSDPLATLTDLRSHRRLVLARIDDARWVADLRASVAVAADGLRERRVTLLIVHDGELLVWLGEDVVGGERLRDEVLRLLDGSGAEVALVGLDGGIKRHYRAERFDPRAVFADIDAMPMRRPQPREGVFDGKHHA